jgi:hypothetical protein
MLGANEDLQGHEFKPSIRKALVILARPRGGLMTTDQDTRYLERQIAAMPGKIRDAERQIAKDRRLNEPKQFRGGELEEFAAVSQQADRAYQASKIIPPPPADFETADMYRLRLATKLLPHAKLSQAETKQLERADSSHAMAQRVFDGALVQASLAPDLRPITSVDAVGRTITEFIGSKNTWMSAYMRQPQIGEIMLDGEPASISTIVS